MSDQPVSPASPRAQELVDWIKTQDQLTAEALRKQMRDINEHYDRLYSEPKDKQ
jgi:hypothetical protein